ncbi:MAG: tetratricopeptide repeat protein [Candidatus Methanomethylophilaceae archaeon]|nr:tetratricopeptide repeat protein [Candidatus Methanomethylophilaceae archaeon]
MSSDPAFDAISKARRQVNGNNANGAVNTLEEYLATDPHNTKPRMELARIAIYELKDLKYGLMQLDIVMDLEPDNTDAMKAAVTVMSKDKKYNKRTEELFERLLSTEPSADLYNLYAKFLRRQVGDFKKAGEYYEKALALKPDDYDIHQNYAVLLLNDLRDYEKARRELEYLLQIKPNDANLKKNYERLMKQKFDKNGNLKKPLFGIRR